MKTFGFAVLLLMALTARASTLVDLVCSGEVIEVLSYDEESCTMELIVNFAEVHPDLSLTDYAAESFMEYNGNTEIQISLEEVGIEDLERIAEGSTIFVNFFDVSSIMRTEGGEPRPYSSRSWTYLGEVSREYLQSLSPVSS